MTIGAFVALLPAMGLSPFAAPAPGAVAPVAPVPVARAAPPPVSPLTPVSPAKAPCTCENAIVTNGWCDRHELGYVAGVKVRSKLVYETLDAHGHILDLTTFTCPTCRKAIETDGFCEEHKNGFVAKQTYFSRLTYELARGKVLDPATLSCAACRKNSRTHGWCVKHKVGMASHVAIADHDSFARVEKAIGILEVANTMASRCENCAVAILTDSFCPIHRIRYRDGKGIGPSGATQTLPPRAIRSEVAGVLGNGGQSPRCQVLIAVSHDRPSVR